MFYDPFIHDYGPEKFLNEAVDFSCNLLPDYASLAPVSHPTCPRKSLIDKYLKQHFKYPVVFHRSVEKPVENLKLELKRGSKKCDFNVFRWAGQSIG